MQPIFSNLIFFIFFSFGISKLSTFQVEYFLTELIILCTIVLPAIVRLCPLACFMQLSQHNERLFTTFTKFLI